MANTIDPLGGSYFLETLTNRMEEEATEIIRKIDDLGGMLVAIEKNYPQQEIADAAYHYQKQLDEKKRVLVGVNRYVTRESLPVEMLQIDEELERRQIEKTNRVKEARDDGQGPGGSGAAGRSLRNRSECDGAPDRRRKGLCDPPGGL